MFIGDCSSWSVLASNFIMQNFSALKILFWEKGMDYPSEVDEWKGDLILSFKSDLILKKGTLMNAKRGGINFHPSSPKYRGIGGYHYSLYNNDTYFAATCHYIDEYIDHGKIISVKQFAINQNENTASLKERTASYCLTLFYDIMSKIINDDPLPSCDQSWGSKLYTISELNEFDERVRGIEI